MSKSININGEDYIAKREKFYVKRGAYEHNYVFGWNLYNQAGKLVIDSDPGRARNPYEYQKARYVTFKELMYRVEDINEYGW